MATITLPKIYTRFETSLAAKMSSSATSFTLSTSVDPASASLSGTYRLTFDEGTSVEEDMIVTMSGSAGTVVIRGLSRADGVTNVAANQFQHDLGASVKITNQVLVSLVRLLNGDDTFNSVNWLGVNSISGLATPTSGETTKAANVAYVNAVSIAGAADAATTVKGIVEIATVAEAAAGTSTGSTGAILAIPASLCNATSSAAHIIPVTEADGDLSIGFMPLDVPWAFTSTVNIPTASNWQLGGTGFTGTMADLNEAATFFNTSGITGAEAETLSDGSNADSLHVHNYNDKLVAGYVGLTDIQTTPQNIVSETIPANTLGTNNAIIGTMAFNATNASNNTMDVELKYGTTSLGTVRVVFTSSSTRHGTIDFCVVANGATNAQRGWVVARHEATGSATSPTAVGQTVDLTDTATIDSTSSQTLTLTAVCDSTSNGSSFNAYGLVVSIIK